MRAKLSITINALFDDYNDKVVVLNFIYNNNIFYNNFK